MKRAIVEIWVGGHKVKTYLEYFDMVSARTLAERRARVKALAIGNVRAKFGWRYPSDAEYRVVH